MSEPEGEGAQRILVPDGPDLQRSARFAVDEVHGRVRLQDVDRKKARKGGKELGFVAVGVRRPSEKGLGVAEEPPRARESPIGRIPRIGERVDRGGEDVEPLAARLRKPPKPKRRILVEGAHLERARVGRLLRSRRNADPGGEHLVPNEEFTRDFRKKVGR